MSKPFATTIALRAYTERPGREPLAIRPASRDVRASEWSLIFDCETTTDVAQQLKVSSYQVRKGNILSEDGLFYDADATTGTEQTLIHSYAKLHHLKLLTIAQFRIDVFLKYGYRRHATVIGFNLPFDLSRIAMNHSPARRHMRGGFSFEMSANHYDPRVRVKHISPRAALIDFAKPGEQDTSRGMRKRKLRVKTYRGHFVDVKTLAAALLSRHFSLRSLAQSLGTNTQKHETDTHGTVTETYLDYARADVQVTWECFAELTRRYQEHGLTKPIDRLLSEASIGKAYLEQMGIKPLLGCDSAFPRARFGEVFCAYYGGRAEVRNRRVIHEVLYCDFKSMYPTVNSLMGLWDFVIADKLTVHDTTEETRAFLKSVTVEDLQNPAAWKELRTVVRIKPQKSIVPVRAKYDGVTHTIGLNYLTAEKPLWFTLADCIVSKLLSGCCPVIDKALTYRPGQAQEGLKSIKIMGREDYSINPLSEDLFRRLIDMRDEAKEKGDAIEKTLKIIANSTSYGIFIEVNRDDAPKSQELSVFGPDGEYVTTMTNAVEEPGRFFNPILGVLITGAARLMLGIAERKIIDLGLDWAFCDTDSLSIIKPHEIPREDFHQKVHQLISWFEKLNPYKKKGSILKFEDVNFGINSNKEKPLYCFAISSKRYALFNLDKNSNPILRKASAHGLGHLMDPYSDSEAPSELPAPQVELNEIGIKRWHHDLWIKIIEAALSKEPDRINFDWHPALLQPAALRYSASSPGLLAWLDKWNATRLYEQQIRPFGFLLSYTARKGVFAPAVSLIVDDSKRGRPRKAECEAIAPIAPYSSNPNDALSKVFDRMTGEPVRPGKLKTYAESLAQYHLSSENKFLGGRFLDRGRTERRHIIVTDVILIGKEANQVRPSGDGDPIVSTVEEFDSVDACRHSSAGCFV